MAELAACVLSLCPVVPPFAGPGEDGARAFKRGDYATALRLWRPLAEQGDAYAQFNLSPSWLIGPFPDPPSSAIIRASSRAHLGNVELCQRGLL
ncbi:hypothetical protein MnTg02_02648 [bacterium MnTg02]|nr:hypothetical protein MnTg02_02648 [bacterium MnTg02]